jgi:PEP-CTERM motif
MKRLSTWVFLSAVMGCLGSTETKAIAGDVIVQISGTFGEFDYGNEPAPLDDGSFSGTVTFAALPGANSTVISDTANVNFYDQYSNLVFNVGGNVPGLTYDTFSADSSGYIYLTVSGITTAGASTVIVAPLGLEFSIWPFASGTGTVKPYGPPNYASEVEYTYYPDGITYFTPVLTGQGGIVPEPSSIVLSMIGAVGVLAFARYNRRSPAA